MLHITALMDNKPTEHKALIAEHGLSFYIEYQDFRMVFDCGSGPNSQRNAHRLGVPLDHLDAVALSHSHYDHAAGYRDLIENDLGSNVLYTGPNFFQRKYAREGIRYTDLSAGFDPDFLEKHHIRHVEVDGVLALREGIWLVSGFPRVHEFETIPERFVRRIGSGFVQDDFSDEICVVIQVQGGLAVLVGCSHPGILNMITHIQELFHQPILGVFGGTHLVEASPERIAITVKKLHEMGVQTIGLSHCSGDAAENYLKTCPEVSGCHLGVGDGIFYA